MTLLDRLPWFDTPDPCEHDFETFKVGTPIKRASWTEKGLKLFVTQSYRRRCTKCDFIRYLPVDADGNMHPTGEVLEEHWIPADELGEILEERDDAD